MTSFNPLDWVLDLFQRCWNMFYGLWTSLGAWDLLIGLIVIFITFRMFLVPLFGGRLSFGSDRVSKKDKDDVLDRTPPRYVDKYGNIRMRK